MNTAPRGDEDEEYELEGLTPSESVLESIQRSIEFMTENGFSNYQITFENEGDNQYEEISLEEVKDLDVWPNNFIRVEFWNERNNQLFF